MLLCPEPCGRQVGWDLLEGLVKARQSGRTEARAEPLVGVGAETQDQDPHRSLVAPEVEVAKR